MLGLRLVILFLAPSWFGDSLYGALGIAGLGVTPVWAIVKHTGQLYRAERIG
jgi:hypothetical protein